MYVYIQGMKNVYICIPQHVIPVQSLLVAILTEHDWSEGQPEGQRHGLAEHKLGCGGGEKGLQGWKGGRMKEEE